MNPPGMTEKRGGGEDGGGLLSSSRICLHKQARRDPSELAGQTAPREGAMEPARTAGDTHDQTSI